LVQLSVGERNFILRGKEENFARGLWNPATATHAPITTFYCNCRCSSVAQIKTRRDTVTEFPDDMLNYPHSILKMLNYCSVQYRLRLTRPTLTPYWILCM